MKPELLSILYFFWGAMFLCFTIIVYLPLFQAFLSMIPMIYAAWNFAKWIESEYIKIISTGPELNIDNAPIPVPSISIKEIIEGWDKGDNDEH